MQKFLQFIILTFIYSSTCFGRPHAHHQELNNCSSSLWFYLRSEAATAVVELLMMGVRTPETCWAVNRRQDNKLEKLLYLVGDLFEWYYIFNRLPPGWKVIVTGFRSPVSSSKLATAISLLVYVGRIPSSILRLVTCCHVLAASFFFIWITKGRPACQNNTSVVLQSFPSKSFLIHHLLLVPLFIII